MPRTISILATAAISGALASRAAAEAPKSPVVYWMSAATASGPAAGAGAPSPMAMMGMLARGGGATKTLTLQLGSPQKSQAAVTAAHSPPAGLRAGPSLPLLPDAKAAIAAADEMPMPNDRPKGRVLIYWGCGEQTRPGQPMVVDFAKPEAMAGLAAGAWRSMHPPTAGRFSTTAQWPNRRANQNVVSGSLAGDHAVTGDQMPDIRFTLRPDQDFLPPVSLVSNAATAGGGQRLEWRPVAGAKAYLATVMGGGDGGAIIMWTSSEAGPVMAATPDYLAPEEVTRQLGRRALLPVGSTSCVVPQAVMKATGAGIFNLTAFGGETNFAYPPRPANATTSWSPDWTVKVRYRSSVGALLGQDLDGADDEAAGSGQAGRKGLAGALLRGLIPHP